LSAKFARPYQPTAHRFTTYVCDWPGGEGLAGTLTGYKCTNTASAMHILWIPQYGTCDNKKSFCAEPTKAVDRVSE